MPVLALLFFVLAGAASGALYFYLLHFWAGAAQLAAWAAAVAAAGFAGARLAPVKSPGVALLCGAGGAVLAVLGLGQGGDTETALLTAGYGVLAGALVALLINPAREVLDRITYLRRALPVGAAVGLVAGLARLDPLADVLRQLAAGGLAWAVAGALLVQLQLVLPQVREHAAGWQQDFAQDVAEQMRVAGTDKAGGASGMAVLAVHLVLGLMGGGTGARTGTFAVVLGLVLDRLFGGVTKGPVFWVSVGGASWLLYLLAPPPEPAAGPDDDEEDDEEDLDYEDDEEPEEDDEEERPRR